MTTWVWFGFFLALGLLLIIARWNLWAALITAAFVLGKFSLSFSQLWEQTVLTLTNPSIILLAISVGLIPVIGGAMEFGGLMDDLVNNLRLKRRSLMAFSSAFVGLLPMPGGALLSAPLIERGGKVVSGKNKTAVNVWYRHVFLLIYPLGMLLATTAMAKINLYTAMLYLLPGFILMLILGYFFLLSNIDNNRNIDRHTDIKKIVLPIVILTIAPLIHFILMMIFPNWLQEIPLLIGVTVSILLSYYFGKLKIKSFKQIVLKMKPWYFALIIVGMFLFLNIFKASETSRVIAEAAFSKIFLIVGVAALLGFTTGRVQVPISILLPIYLAQFGANAMTPLIFAIMFFSAYQGYIISPVHPCVSVSLAFFRTDLKSFYKSLAIPALIGLGFAWLVAECALKLY